jgi:hypothetical protein
MKQWLMTLLNSLETALPPPAGAHHAITAARYGSEGAGWDDRLALHLMLDGERVTLFLDDDDFASSTDALVAEIVACNAARSKTPNA